MKNKKLSFPYLLAVTRNCVKVLAEMLTRFLCHPQQHLLSKILKDNLEAPYNLFISEVENVFDLCLAKCRTSSLVRTFFPGLILGDL